MVIATDNYAFRPYQNNDRSFSNKVLFKEREACTTALAFGEESSGQAKEVGRFCEDTIPVVIFRQLIHRQVPRC